MGRHRSILTTEDDRCFLCRRYCDPEWHHVFGAANRKNSEKYGLVVPLCHYCHNEPPDGVHFNKGRRLRLQAKAQQMFESIEDHESFMDVFGRNYIGEYLIYLEEQDEQLGRSGTDKRDE